MSSGLVSISLVQRSVLQFIQSAHKTNEFLPVYARDKRAFIGVFVLLGDETHRKDQSVPVFVVLVFARHEREDVVEARLVELEERDGEVEAMDGSADDLDCVRGVVPLR